MNNHQLPTGPALLVALDDAPLKPIDILGRQKIIDSGLNKGSTDAEIKKKARSSFAKSDRNAYKYKSLSSWAYNIAVGCTHGCLFCYVPDAQQTGLGKKKPNNGPLAKILREFGVVDPDAEWGDYLLLRPFDEEIFLASLKAAENTPLNKLNPDGNRAIIFCSTTDPYQTIVIPGDPAKQKLLNHLRRHLVRRALELILEHSTLNVRILTRSPLAKEDFDLYLRFGPRLLFGMSLPTLRNDLARIYEPHAPAPSQRLATLQAAKAAGIPIFVAMAPTYPECDEADLRATLEAIRPLNPVTIFHEPINMRAKNVTRITTHAAELGVTLRSGVFANPTTWRRYAIEQLVAVEKIATELGMLDQLHLWPDKSLRSKNEYMKVRELIFQESHPEGHNETPQEKRQRRALDEAACALAEQWVSYWHNRISRWPGLANTVALASPSEASAMPTEATAASASVELVDDDDLSADDREFLNQQEKTIAGGQKVFLEVGTALLHIRDYKAGILYRRYGTFEDYCRQRWDFSRAHSHRQIVAASIYIGMSPRGDIPSETVLPTTERQLRELGRLPTVELHQAAWQDAVAAAGERPVRTRDVANAVRAVIEREGLKPPATENSAKAKMCRIAAQSVTKIRTGLNQLRAAITKFKGTPKINPILDEIEALLPTIGGKP